MNDEKIKTGIKEIRKIKMTEREKEQIFKNILSFSDIKIEPIKSHYSFASFFQRNNLAYYGVVFCLILILGGGTAVNYFQNQNQRVAKINQESKIDTFTINPNENESDTIPATKKIPKDQKAIPSPLLPTSPLVQNKNNENVSSSDTTTSMLAPVTENSDSQKYVTIANTTLTNWLKETSKKRGDVLDYKINKITFITLKENAEEPLKSNFNSFESNDSFLIEVNYSVQIAPNGDWEYWMTSGYGAEEPNGWITYKASMAILDKDKNGVYVLKSIGKGLR